MTPTRTEPSPDQLRVKYEVPGYPGLYVRYARNGGAVLCTRWTRRRATDPTNVVGGLGPYLGEGGIGADADTAVQAILDNVDRWLCWPHLTQSEIERARKWRHRDTEPQ